ncbi:alpha/beta fold hydrolase [Gordonibacter massiliensis (ex Traore et al. 2017)]|uniref:alpha/beta fold hydrolase n=1 Tax=Gordonibacter massiliensis (ex Traore et al. 2017) TaxID=1841863 RepID=UPI001C8C4E80|nr:alpha/beta hydrolase [Gordonibacter massiliensis (ex Traore et al. 2017)]MBX9033013.1 alpha/beta hydrolase [Gordonibacter massiliensis (ex Traore et al. 2017)]
MIAAIVVGILAVCGAIALAVYVDGNRHGEERDLARAYAAGFVEKQATVEVALGGESASGVGTEGDAEAAPDGGATSGEAFPAAEGNARSAAAVVNYAEGPDNGPALVLVHGQGMQWEDYARVLPDLAQRYHVFAVDCFGHGESSHDPALYSCRAIGEAIKAFAAQEIGGPYLATGHSSGGIVAAWLAANDAERVTGCVLEDPPFFRVTPSEMRQEPGCFVWKDGFEVTHAFLQQSEVVDPAVYYAQHSYLFGLFGGLQPKIAEWTAQERAANPDAHLTLAWVPHDWVRGLYFYDDFDVRFSEAFYDGTWFDGVDQVDVLGRIACPAVYLKAQTNYGEDGVLFAANSDEDAARVQQLVANCETVVVKSGHDIHYERPQTFADAIDRAA